VQLRVIRERVFRRRDYLVFMLLSVLTLSVIGNVAVAWLRYGYSTQRLLLFSLGTILVLPMLVNQQARWFLLLAMCRPRPMAPEKGLRVAVATTYVPGAESREMLEHSLSALVALNYPHDTWLLDEGADAEVRATCERLGVCCFSRKDRPEYQTVSGQFQSGSKHGNYNAWLDAVGFHRYDVLAAFDPDHVADPEFLDHVLGYFRDPVVGYVQPAQSFYNQGASFVARGAAEETYAYHSTVQMASYGLGYPVIVGGHNIHRVSALKAVSGFAAHDADDLLVTLRYRAAGWQGVYVPRILARGLVPVDWRGYLTQQRRWARSVLDLKLRRRGEFVSKLPLPSRIVSFLHGMNFLYRHVVTLVALMILLQLLMGGGHAFGLSGGAMLALAPLLGMLGLQELYRQQFYLAREREQGIHWRATVLEYASWPWFILAILDALMGRRPKYAVTQKSKHAGRCLEFIGVHAGVTAAVGLAWMAGVAAGQAASPQVMVLAGLVVVCNLALIGTELRGFPPPWDLRLARAKTGPGRL
jgi:cellulose synthase/poly-beta-1,6-N-acetylglucosamine synthase-like glycosyltransferase